MNMTLRTVVVGSLACFAVPALPGVSICADPPKTGVMQGAEDLAPVVLSELEERARGLGLDPASPTLAADIQGFIEDKAVPEMRAMLQADLQRLGLPADATWKDVVDKGRALFLETGEDGLLGIAARKLGLEPGATWKDAADAFSERGRNAAAGGLGLDPKTATWAQIAKSAKALAQPPKGAEKLTNTLLKTAAQGAKAAASAKPKLEIKSRSGK